ncbi:MAG TPA: acyl carrier protein [Desulfuromonadales bacterium]|jgi:acyl carrier protein
MMKTIDRIRQFIVSELQADVGGGIADDDSLIDQGIIDSFGIMALLGFLEERFDVIIDGDELLPENFATLAAISALVEKKVGIAALD